MTHQHPQVLRPQRLEGRAKMPAAPSRSCVLQAAAVAADAHGHVRILGFHPELGKEPDEGGVRAVVVHDEARVHSQSRRRLRHVVGMCVPAGPGVSLEEGDAIAPAEDVGGGQARDPTADDGDAPAPAAASFRCGVRHSGRFRRLHSVLGSVTIFAPLLNSCLIGYQGQFGAVRDTDGWESFSCREQPE